MNGLREDWEVIPTLLPTGWQEQARRTGTLRRTRGFKDAASLLRVMLIHWVDGCALRETAVRARVGGLADVSDVEGKKQHELSLASFFPFDRGERIGDSADRDDDVERLREAIISATQAVFLYWSP